MRSHPRSSRQPSSGLVEPARNDERSGHAQQPHPRRVSAERGRSGDRRRAARRAVRDRRLSLDAARQRPVDARRGRRARGAADDPRHGDPDDLCTSARSACRRSGHRRRPRVRRLGSTRRLPGTMSLGPASACTDRVRDVRPLAGLSSPTAHRGHRVPARRAAASTWFGRPDQPAGRSGGGRARSRCGGVHERVRARSVAMPRRDREQAGRGHEGARDPAGDRGDGARRSGARRPRHRRERRRRGPPAVGRRPGEPGSRPFGGHVLRLDARSRAERTQPPTSSSEWAARPLAHLRSASRSSCAASKGGIGPSLETPRRCCTETASGATSRNPIRWSGSRSTFVRSSTMRRRAVSLGEYGREFAVEHFGLDAMAERLVDVYAAGACRSSSRSWFLDLPVEVRPGISWLKRRWDGATGRRAR